MARLGLSGHEWRIYLVNLAANVAVAVLGYLLFGGWRLFAHRYDDAPSEGDPEGPPTLRCLLTTGQFRRLSEQIAGLMASGRPLCPMCGAPLTDAPHFCPPSNGHLHPAEEAE